MQDGFVGQPVFPQRFHIRPLGRGGAARELLCVCDDGLVGGWERRSPCRGLQSVGKRLVTRDAAQRSAVLCDSVVAVIGERHDDCNRFSLYSGKRRRSIHEAAVQFVVRQKGVRVERLHR